MIEENQIPQQNTIVFHITQDQAEKICNYYNKEISQLEEYEILELLDDIIDKL